MSDYEIDEIRRIRHRISEGHGHDLGRIAEHYRAMEAELRKSGRYRFADERVHDARNADRREVLEIQS
uniref:Uncharacterized protein n=1 Tax=Candidatus Kentrum sp. FM TaxID=2126340 RepID=A0A450SET2_9GAMM|nr:MAG: hypothetical protein BECKFM1743A_GA0114220_1009116 [Candidatus Kentron sp. FM]VFJ51319.1 MAG: hypothetical protein BECKFM1743C_GA0114222_1009516 [Candidatus Kentron sp. FM]VFK08885.1 MAG: hypothetical protein BECKFM1743B_GA0114221_1008415 [Candidatus Kentron sp. FM]